MHEPKAAAGARAGQDGTEQAERAERAEQQARRANGPVLKQTGASGAKGFAIILGTMVGIIGLLWLIATLVAPH
jgi:hypothetical protein